jgi:predicted PurR-regulated permease PerM
MATEAPSISTPASKLEATLATRAETFAKRWPLNVVGVGFILGFCYYAEMVMVVTLVAILLAFILAPLVDILMALRLPRSLSAIIALLLLLTTLGGIVYYSSNQALIFARDLPHYADKVRDKMESFRQKAESFLDLTSQPESGVVSVRPATDWTNLLTRGFGSFSEGLLLASFVPFLCYFMLSWQEHVRSATVMLFAPENRHAAYTTLGLISAMIRSFMVGNLILGLLIGSLSTVAFWLLHIPFFYFIGFISGFLSLVPYMGVLLALVPPIFLGLGHVGSQDMVAIVVTVVGLHLIASNVFYPKFLGKRLQLNPLAVSLSLLLWAWLWGAPGLLLAIPITAAMKIIFDHVDGMKPFAAWLGE